MSRKSAHKTRKSSGPLSVDEIAKGLKCSRSEAIKGLSQLEELKLIELDGTSRKGGGKWKPTGLGMATVAMLKATADSSPKDRVLRNPSPLLLTLYTPAQVG